MALKWRNIAQLVHLHPRDVLSVTRAKGGHWMTLSVSTTYLGKIHTLALTDGNITV